MFMLGLRKRALPRHVRSLCGGFSHAQVGFFAHVFYTSGRIVTYVAVGAAMGAVGAGPLAWR